MNNNVLFCKNNGMMLISRGRARFLAPRVDLARLAGRDLGCLGSSGDQDHITGAKQGG